MLLRTLFISLSFIWLSCSGKASNPPSTNPRHTLTTSQMDSIRLLDGKVITPFLWKALNPYPDTDMPDTIHVLSGNLDQDDDPEMVIWYNLGYSGEALCFDKKKDLWHYANAVGMDFGRECRPPYLDTQLGALVNHTYGWGTSYSAVLLEFYMLRDTVVRVFELTQMEYTAVVLGGYSRAVEGNYRVINRDAIDVTFDYEVYCQTSGRHMDKPMYNGSVRVPYTWNDTLGLFVPHPPGGFSQPEHLPDAYLGEVFETWFEPALDRIRKTGPKWKRKALQHTE